MGFDHDADKARAQVDLVLAAVGSVRLSQDIRVKRLLGNVAAAASVIPPGLLHIRTFQFWLKSGNFSL